MTGSNAEQELQFEARLEIDAAGSFPIGRIATIGRAPGCDIIVNTPSVSRQHARIFLEGNHFWIKDLESANGTYVNGKIATIQMLSDGDILCFGEVRSVFRSLTKNGQGPAAVAQDPLAGVKDSFSDGTPTGDWVIPNLQATAKTQAGTDQGAEAGTPASTEADAQPAAEEALSRKIQELESENVRLKKLVAQLERVLADSNLRVRNLQERLGRS
jgi:pSer/pThr/pTyr-binding forkhead associated (FHA) protein